MQARELPVQQLIQIIETQLEWGEGSTWSNKDFETLSVQIFKQTQQQLSVTTLKRIWGRAKRIANPSVTSLDILANFAGFDNWRTFQQQTETIHSKEADIQPIPFFHWSWILGFAIFLMGLSSFFLFKKETNKTTSEKTLTLTEIDQIQFDFEKVAIDYPNTVIFKYDLGDIAYDSAAIQQNWDSNRRIKLADSKGVVTSTYYTSGYFKTKLVVDNQIIKEKDLYIPTNGWRGFIGGNVPQVLYLQPEQIIQDTSIRIATSVLEALNQFHPSKVYFTNLSATPSINSRHFELETEFRLQQATNKSICKKVSVVIIGTKDVFMFQLSIPGCVGELQQYIDGQSLSGKNHDFSALGIVPTDWTHFKVVNNDNQLAIFLNEQLVYERTLVDDIGKIGGAQFSFEGLGEVRLLQLKDEMEVVDLLL